MNIKSIATLGLVAFALAATSVAPAQANNNAYLNQLAMQMYLQNQATAAAYNPVIPANYTYPVYGAATNPYAAYGVPYTTVVNPVVNYRNVVVPHFVRHDGWERFHR